MAEIAQVQQAASAGAGQGASPAEGLAAVVRQLEADPGNGLAAVLARLGRTLAGQMGAATPTGQSVAGQAGAERMGAETPVFFRRVSSVRKSGAAQGAAGLLIVGATGRG